MSYGMIQLRLNANGTEAGDAILATIGRLIDDAYAAGSREGLSELTTIRENTPTRARLRWYIDGAIARLTSRIEDM